MQSLLSTHVLAVFVGVISRRVSWDLIGAPHADMEWYEIVGIVLLVILCIIVIVGVMIVGEEGGIIILLCLPVMAALSPCWCSAYWLVRDK